MGFDKRLRSAGRFGHLLLLCDEHAPHLPGRDCHHQIIEVRLAPGSKPMDSQPTQTTSADLPASKLQMVPIAQIKASPHQARKLFDEENLWKLAESLRQEGLIQPITVRKLLPMAGDREDLGYELVSGER